MSSRIESTRALVGVIARLAHPPRVLANASAVGYYGDRGDEDLDETSPPGQGFLAGVCQAWEKEAQTASGAGIRTVILRFGMVLGPGGGALERLIPIYRTGLGAPLGTGRQWVSWIALDDALAAILHVLLETRMAGPVNAVAPNPVRNAEFSDALARVLGRGTVAHVPRFVLRAAFGEMADEMLLASTRVRPQQLLQNGFKFAHPDLVDALRAAV